jgi:hypothetical protein
MNKTWKINKGAELFSVCYVKGYICLQLRPVGTADLNAENISSEGSRLSNLAKSHLCCGILDDFWKLAEVGNRLGEPRQLLLLRR